MREGASHTGHDAGEEVLVETRIHEHQIMRERRSQTEVSDRLTHSVGVVTNRFHLRDGRLRSTSVIIDARELFLTEFILEFDAWRGVEGIDGRIALQHVLPGRRAGAPS